MINFYSLINQIADQLHNYVDEKVIYERQRIPYKLIDDNNLVGKKIKKIIPEKNKKNNIKKRLVPSNNPNFTTDVEYEINNNSKIKYEITAYSKKELDSINTAQKCYNYYNINQLAQYYFDDNYGNISINNLSDVGEKSNILENNYQYRYYFEFEMQITDNIKILESTIENINLNLN